ncbi:MAG: alpha-galactosidase [Clostridiales Family XIII bacterium]|jgi:alpha-galactosidase|nr:alpha-galactosidase [Clostridiales Family XIII bacterium]
MAIQYFEQERVFKLDTPNTTYLIGVVDEEGYLGHLYYGARLENGQGLGYLLRTEEAPFVPSKNNREKSSFLDFFHTEYPTGGVGDYRESALEVRNADGFTACQLQYQDYEILDGKYDIPGMPATFADAAQSSHAQSSQATTLRIRCVDSVLNLEVILQYGVFEDVDAITRSVIIQNHDDSPVYLEKVLSASIDMDMEDYEMLTLHGSWARERHIQRNKLVYGRQSIGSFRGESGHQEHPFIALVSPDTTQEHGSVYAMSFVYSGNFIAQAEVSQFDSVRLQMGIHTQGFSWKLDPKETFYSPEVVLTYSGNGLDHMTHTFHNLYRNHLIRSPYLHQERPILINNWEATYFDFDREKLLAIARDAKDAGIEMLVMDDGWFGKRSSDDSSLGDWFVNEEKLQGGLSYLVDEVKNIGLKFGIWFEPEMISPDSNLYRAHPDWAISIPRRDATQSRSQFVLDLSRPEVIDYTYEQVAKILRSAPIDYVKWDMNRQLSDLGSVYLEADKMGELSHRYVLGVYELQERLVTEFPDLLLENCSGGGARFDPGMLYYSPQIWCSDDTDAIERLQIQEGTALVYPLSTIGAHVSDCPNHSVGRTTPFKTRGDVALAGTFGYELDITKIPDADRAMIPEQTAQYHKYHELIREGTYYRIASWGTNHSYDCYMVVNQDKTDALVTYVQVLGQANVHTKKMKLKGLDAGATYELEGTSEQYLGESLMNAGYIVPKLWGDFQSILLHFIRV